MVRYAVRRYDTLGNISARFGVSVDAIMRANGLRHYHVYPGMVLYIPVHHYPYYPPHHQYPGYSHQHYGQQHYYGHDHHGHYGQGQHDHYHR